MGRRGVSGTRTRPIQPNAPHGVSLPPLVPQIWPEVSWRINWPCYPVAPSGLDRLAPWGLVPTDRFVRNSRPRAKCVTLELPCRLPGSYPGARAPKKDDGRGRPSATTELRAFDAPSPWPATERDAVVLHLAVAGAWPIVSVWGLPCSYPVAYPVATLYHRVAGTKSATARSTSHGRRRAQRQRRAHEKPRSVAPASLPCVAWILSYPGGCPGALQGKPTETARAENG